MRSTVRIKTTTPPIPAMPRQLKELLEPLNRPQPKPLPYDADRGSKWLAVAGFLAVVIPGMVISSYAVGHWVFRQLTK